MQLLLDTMHYGFRSGTAALFYYLAVQTILYVQAKDVTIERWNSLRLRLSDFQALQKNLLKRKT